VIRYTHNKRRANVSGATTRAAGGGTDLEARFLERLRGSRRLYDRAQRLFPSGLTHDSRRFQPFPVYIDRAAGSKKYDPDGNEYIDYSVGHGALILGHSHPAVVDAVQRQMAIGTHYGAEHELELKWGELVCRMVPSAERIRFVSSGTEATLMAIRLARTATGRNKIVKFEGHFHGWHDQVVVGITPPFAAYASPGIPEAVRQLTVVLPHNDLAAVEAALAQDRDIAAVILEPAGGFGSMIPTTRGFLPALRALTKKQGVLLIFDEVVSGFRYAPGGAQEYFGVTPDLTTLAKILAGGLPGGAVAGPADLLAALEFRDDPHWNRHKKIHHPGTFNANPLSAAAGVAALSVLADGKAYKPLEERTARLREGLAEVLRRRGVPGLVYGDSSFFYFYFGEPAAVFAGDPYTEPYDHRQVIAGRQSPFRSALSLAMLLHGVHLHGAGGKLSIAHSEADVEKTIAALDSSLALVGSMAT
jgi:glutamate-1-semialdehyde 2,1-aminomutase